MPLLVLSAADVAQVTQGIPASVYLDMLGSTMNAVSNHREVPGTVAAIQNPQRIMTESELHKTLYMPARLASSTQGSATSIKVVAAPKSSCTVPGLPATTLLMTEETGRVDAIVNSSELTGIRTAAASALATSILANPKSENLRVFGSGTQAAYHARLLLELYPTIATVSFIVRQSSTRSRELLERTSSKYTGTTVRLVTTGARVSEVVKTADIICTCVPSTEALFSVEDLKRGVHINAIGSYTPSMFEFPPSLISPPSTLSAASEESSGTEPTPPRIPNILVDSRTACLEEAGELIQSGIAAENLFEIGQLCDEHGKLRQDEATDRICNSLRSPPGNRSLFKCVGVGAMDVAITKLVVEEAKRRGLGTILDF